MQLSEGTLSWTLEVKTVNGRSLDVRCRLPHAFSSLEPELRKCASRFLDRGNTSVSLNYALDAQSKLANINKPLLRSILENARQFSDEFDLQPLTMDGALAIKGVLEVGGENEIGTLSDDVTSAFLADLELLFKGLVASRESEGAALQEVLLRIVEEIATTTKSIKQAPERSAEAIKERLKTQVDALLDNGSELSPDRLYQEALMLAAKADVQEELDRLEAHIVSARELLNSETVVGRKLDFLGQEFNREANTICSKANHIAITNLGLALKGSIDQFREQVLNVE